MNTKGESETLELFYNVYLFIKRFFLLFLLFILAGAGYGVYKSKHQRQTFTRDILICSADIPYALIRQFTMTISADIEARNYKSLAAKLQLGEDIAAKITAVKVDSVSHKARMYALTTFSFTDTTGCSGISKNYTTFLSGNESLHGIISLNKTKNSQILEKINVKLAELDALHGKPSAVPQLNGSYREYIDLYADKLEYESKIARSGIVSVNESTTVSVAGFGLLVSVIIYGMIFLVMAIVTAFLIDILSKVRTLEKRRKQASQPDKSR